MLDVAACAGLLLLSALLYRPLLWPWGHPARLLTTDFTSDFYPWLAYSVRSLRSGVVPWWSPLAGCGVPFVAILENGVFFPGHLLLGWLTPGPTVSFFAAQVYQVLSLSLSGIGVYVLLRELGTGPLGALVAAGAWAASRDLTYHLVYVDYIDVLVCFPILLWLTYRAVVRGSPWALGGAALTLGASLLAGNPQWTVMHVYALGVLYLGWQAPALVSAPPRRWPGLLAPLGLIVLAGALVAAIQLIPSWELYRVSPRMGTGLAFASADSSPLAFAWRRLRTDSPFGRGGGLFLLAGLGLLAGRRATAWAMAVIGLLAFGLVQGQHALVYRLGYHLLPGLGLFRFPGRFFHLTVFALAVLAGLGADDVWRRADRPRPFAIAGVAGLTLLAAALGWGGWVTLAQGVGLGVGFLVGGRPRWRRALLVAVLASAVAFPAYFPHRSPRWVAQAADFYVADPLVPWLQAQPGLYRITNPGALIHHAQARDYWTVHRWFFQGHYVTGIPSWTAASAQLHLSALDRFVAQTWYRRLYDLMNIRFRPQGLDPPPGAEGKYQSWELRPGSRWQVDLAGLAPLDGAVALGVTGGALEVEASRGGGTVRTRWEPGRAQAIALPAGRLLTVRVRNGRARAVSLRVGGQEVLEAQPRWQQVQPGLWENRHVLPRAFVTHDSEVYPDRDAVWRALPGVEPMATTLLEEEPRFAAAAGPSAAEDGLRLETYEPERVEVAVHLTRPGFLVLTDTHYPGWRAEVDSAPARILRADYLFRAVALGSGEHRVVFRYAPRWRPFAWALSGLGLAAVAAPLVWRRPAAAPVCGGAHRR
jgi:hypothetical protein